jgi:hypothetical protein
MIQALSDAVEIFCNSVYRCPEAALAQLVEHRIRKRGVALLKNEW